METQTLYIIVIVILIGADLLLAWRIARLERRMMETVQHFVGAKDFLGKIAKTLSNYKGVAEGITKHGLDIKLKSEKLGEFELNIKGRGK
jgi:hypothetical protein